MASQSYIELRGITKIFGTVVANDQVDLSVRKGEIHALLGENGSGKSTLVNMLSGIYSPDGGTITIDGKEQRFQSPGTPSGRASAWCTSISSWWRCSAPRKTLS